jgi:hypothetical protein
MEGKKRGRKPKEFGPRPVQASVRGPIKIRRIEVKAKARHEASCHRQPSQASCHSSLLHFSQTVDVSFFPIFEDKENENYSLSDEEHSGEEGADLDAWFEPENCLSSSRLTMK